ncbi:MAG: flagellar biosynthesis protein FlhF [Bdellovibrionales bacterium RIFOXYD1_FULL_53_11]|nr:MAG: flagellar biosynthesis protein FlhF [Bdellovibrionales bacterium RIFOXYD1_FULL_53_11]
MQIKKFEAPTVQEALDTIKRELGPEAIILQTRKYKKGFGLLSKPSVEVTAAVSERSLQRKKVTEVRMPENTREVIGRLPAARQAEVFDKYAKGLLDRAASARDGVELSAEAATKKVTKTRYIDITDEPGPVARRREREPAYMQPRQEPQAAPSGANVPNEIAEELRQLKRIVSEMKTAGDENMLGSGAQALMSSPNLFTPALQDAFEQLVVNGIDRKFALSLLKRVNFDLGPEKSSKPDAVLDQLAGEILISTETLSALEGIKPRAGRPEGAPPAVFVLVGPTGVGKTTTVAKIASEAILKNKLKVGLINLDNYRIGAFDQLATYAKILNVPFRSVQSADDFKSALSEFSSLDLVLVDTAGRSQKDTQALKDMEQLLGSIEGARTHLVISATTRDTELYETAARFSVLRPAGLIVSKIDEASVFGSVYNVSQRTKLPLMYFTTGQRVPEDIEEASPERVVSLVMDL